MSVEFKTWSSWSRHAGPYSHRVTFHSDLSAEYSGFAFTDRLGEYRGSISKQDWQALVTLLMSVGFDSMPTKFPSPDAVDGGHRRITVTRADEAKSVEDYLKSGSPQWESLVQHLRELTESVQWEPRAP